MLELVLRLGVSLAVVLGLFWLVARTSARKLGGGQALLRVRGRQSLSRTASVAVVEVGGRVLVVGVSDGGVRLLTELDPEEIAQPEARPDAGLAARTSGTVAPSLRGLAAGTSGALGGSLISARTWKQAWAAANRKMDATSSTEGAAHE